MQDQLNYVSSITKSLQKVNPYKVFLFGSVAAGNYSENSDIDIAVILDSDEMPQNYDEKLKTKVAVRRSIMDISGQVPIDLLVYSKSEFQKLKEVNPGFAREVEKGRVVYEKTYS